MRLRPPLLAGLCLALCTHAKADTIDHLTLTTTAFDATNVTTFTFVEGHVTDATGYAPVTIDSDPTKTGTLYYFSSLFSLRIYSGQDRVVTYTGLSVALGSSGRTGTDDTAYPLLVTFTPGTYKLIAPSITLGEGGTFTPDSATVTITQDLPAVKPIFPVAPPPTLPSTPVTPGPAVTAVTPEPSSLVLLGTGLLGLAGVARRRLRAGM